MLTRIAAALIVTVFVVTSVSNAWGQSVRDLQLVRHSENSNAFSQTYCVKYSDIYPEDAAKIRQQIEAFKQQKNEEIRRVRAQGKDALARQIQAEARQKLEDLVATINRDHPQTSVTIWGKAVKSDIRPALLMLKNSPDLLGRPMHVYLKNGEVSVSSNPPGKGEFDRRPVERVTHAPSGSLEPTEAQQREIARNNLFDAIMSGRDPNTGRKNKN